MRRGYESVRCEDEDVDEDEDEDQDQSDISGREMELVEGDSADDNQEEGEEDEGDKNEVSALILSRTKVTNAVRTKASIIKIARLGFYSLLLATSLLLLGILAFIFSYPNAYLKWMQIYKSGLRGDPQGGDSETVSEAVSTTTTESVHGGKNPTSGSNATVPNNERHFIQNHTSFFVGAEDFAVKPGTTVICWGPVLFKPEDKSIRNRATLLKFIPRVNMEIVHHMVLFGSADSQLSPKRATEAPSEKNGDNVCWNSLQSSIIYSWARVGQIDGHPIEFEVPDGSGFDIGTHGSGASYTSFFLNIHYENRGKNENTVTDSSGFELVVVPRPPHVPVANDIMQLSVVWLHSERIHLPPKMKDVTVCVEFKVGGAEDQDSAEVVAYREHGHRNARNFYTDVFRKGKIRVGRIAERSAQEAQIYYHLMPEKPAAYIRKGDLLRLTCHYNTMDKDAVIKYSASELEGEMCNQYLMGTLTLDQHDAGRPCNTAATDSVAFDKGKEVKWDHALKFGEVASLALSKSARGTRLSVFHRSDRTFWNTELIPGATIISGVPNSVASFHGLTHSEGGRYGENQFIVPHGLFSDKWGFLWATDTKLHQVFRIHAMSGEVVLKLGEAKKPSDDNFHFNQPTDVALSPDGMLAYITDGYGNSRVVVYAATSKLAVERSVDPDNESYVFSHAWGTFGSLPGEFDTPHSIAVDSRGRVYVADRHNARVQVFHHGGPVPGSNGVPLAIWNAPRDRVTPWSTLSTLQKSAAAGKGVDGSTWLYHVTALCYEPYLDVVFVIEGTDIVMRSVSGNELQRIDGSGSFDAPSLRWPHDIDAAISPDGKHVTVFVAELKGKRVRQYMISTQ